MRLFKQLFIIQTLISDGLLIYHDGLRDVKLHRPRSDSPSCGEDDRCLIENLTYIIFFNYSMYIHVYMYMYIYIYTIIEIYIVQPRTWYVHIHREIYTVYLFQMHPSYVCMYIYIYIMYVYIYILCIYKYIMYIYIWIYIYIYTYFCIHVYIFIHTWICKDL